MSTLPDHFQLFDIEPCFALDLAKLDRAYLSVQEQVHPDRFATGSAAESRVAVQWAARANEAYQTLKSPLKRAAYLCERAGVPINAESNTAMPSEFLIQQLEWRETLEAARDRTDSAALDALSDAMQHERENRISEISRALDVDHDYALAASSVRQLMFIDKFGSEISAARDAFVKQQA